MKKFLLSLMLAFAVCTPAFAHSHVGVYIQAPGLSIGYHNGWRGHDRFDMRVYPTYQNPAYPYQRYPYYPSRPNYIYQQVPTYCVDYYGNPYVCGYHTILVAVPQY